MFQRLIYILIGVLGLTVLQGCSSAPTPKEIVGQYRAVLKSEGGDLAFPIHISSHSDSLSGFVVNGVDTVSFNDVHIKGDSLIMGFTYYDSYLRGKVSYDGSLSGIWKRQNAGGNYITMPFSAQKGKKDRYPSQKQTYYPFDGKWQVTFTDKDGTFPAEGQFVSQPGGKLYGTFQTETGDYRFLDGRYRDSTFTLSTFDGAHAFLFKGRLTDENTISGDFWSKDSYHASWKAKKGSDNLQDPLAMYSKGTIGNEVSFSFTDLQGKTVSASDPEYQDKPMLVYLFGSWCPNCADEARMLKKIYTNKYQDSDLKIVGLAFEYSDDLNKSKEMVSKYRKRFNIPWKLLIAGTSSKAKAANQLSFIDDIYSYPTSIFINRNHKINAVHVGFNGPATGSAYYNEIQRYKEQINAIIK